MIAITSYIRYFTVLHILDGEIYNASMYVMCVCVCVSILFSVLFW